MNKKGSMKLSINAIVILIIALVVLGVGILFVRGGLSQAEATTSKALSANEITIIPATNDNPFVMDKEISVNAKENKAGAQISVFNPYDSTVYADITKESCMDMNGKDVSDKVYVTEIYNVTIPTQNRGSYQAIFTLEEVGTYFLTGDLVTCKMRATFKNSQVWQEGKSPIKEASIIIYID